MATTYRITLVGAGGPLDSRTHVTSENYLHMATFAHIASDWVLADGDKIVITTGGDEDE